jgi:decaprenylphospho-beta-D-erythro-pentofuranosid-2-ulose 2-reductase
MLNSLGQPDTLLLIGGTSEIAASVAATIARRRPLHVVLAARPSSRRTAATHVLTGLGASVEVVDFDATDIGRALEGLGALLARREIDVAVVAQGHLPAQSEVEDDPVLAVETCTVNYTAAVAVGLLLARRMREQGHGVIVALSSLAAIRPRRANFVYGSSKAGLDAFYTGLRDRLRGSGVRVLVIRPGFVHSRMTRGLKPAPLAVTPQDVADAVVAAIPAGNGGVWVPRAARPLMLLVRMMPGPVFRRVGL